MLEIKFNVSFKGNLGTMFKDIDIVSNGLEAKLKLDLNKVLNIHANFKVGENSFTELVDIINIDEQLVKIPFRTDVIKKGVHEFELVATMKDGSVKASQTYIYKVVDSLENPNAVESETNYPLLIELLQDVSQALEETEKAINRIDTTIVEVKADIDNYKEATTNELNQDLTEYKEATTNELNNKFNSLTGQVNAKITEVDNAKVDLINQVNETLDSKADEINDLMDEVEKAESIRDAKVEVLDLELSNIKDEQLAQNSRISNLELRTGNIETRLDKKDKEDKRRDLFIQGLLSNNKTISLEEEGSNINLDYSSENGIAVIDKVEGRTLVNVNNVPTGIVATGNVDFTQDVKTNIQLEGETLVNVCDQKEPIAITKSYTVENSGNHIPLQGEYDGKCRPVIQGNTMYYNNDTDELSDTFVEEANLTLKSSFEDNLVTQAMVDSGEESVENLGKYKVEYKVTGKNKFDGNWIIGSLNSNGVYNSSYSDRITSDYIAVTPNSFYCITNGITIGRICGYDRNYKFVSSISIEKPIEIPSDVSYIRFHVMDNNDITTKLQLEEGTEATEYEAYKEYTKTFYLNSPLLEGDTIEDIGGKATHVKRYKLIKDASLYVHQDNSWIINNDAILLSQTNDKKKDGVIISTDTKIGIVTPGGIHYLALHGCAELGITTLDKGKEYLKSCKIVYELASPIYESISTESILCDSYVNGHLDFDTNVPIGKVQFLDNYLRLRHLKASTRYTLQFEADNEGHLDWFTFGNIHTTNKPISKGVNKFIITTNTTVNSTSPLLYLGGIGFNASNIQVVETDKDIDFEYFNGIQSTFEDSLVTDEADENYGKYKVETIHHASSTIFGKGGRL